MTPPEVTAGPVTSRPQLFSEAPWDETTALGAWLAPGALEDEELQRRRAAEHLAARLGDLQPALSLVPRRERERLELLTAWTVALAGTARDVGESAERLPRLHRGAFHFARALAGEPADSAFLRLLAAENARRAFGRPSLEVLLAVAREAVAAPRPADAADRARRARRAAAAFAAALFGTDPSPATSDLAAGLVRLLDLRELPADLAQNRCSLPLDVLPEPLQYRRPEEIAAAAAAECEALRPLLLRGARAVAEVPLSFRRAVAFLLPMSLELLAAIEERPADLARRTPRLSSWNRRRAWWRARWTPLG